MYTPAIYMSLSVIVIPEGEVIVIFPDDVQCAPIGICELPSSTYADIEFVPKLAGNPVKIVPPE